MTTIFGSKGGGGSQPAHGGVESPNTLRSNTIARIVEMLGSGEIVGLVDENGTPVDNTTINKAIFFDDTPTMNQNGSVNFNGVTADQRVGLPDQDYLLGFNQAETPVNVNVQVKFATGAVVRTIDDADADSVRVVVRIPALAIQNVDTGDITGATLTYAFDVRPAGGGTWTQVVLGDIQNQKCTSPYFRAHRIELPAGGAPWDIRMRRLTGDASDVSTQNESWWDSYTIVTEGKFIYPNKALVALQVDAAQFGSSMPSRAFRVKGLKTNVPSNYDPETRVYTGVWDGTFKKVWHNNPAWVFFDLLENNRYGLGEFIDATTIDKFGLYQIAQYCDQLVPSGFMDEMGAAIMEPRFVFNGVINDRKDAYKVLQDVTAAFRAMAYWSLGQVFASTDMPADPVTTLTPANVVGGRFKYSGTALKARHSVALVSWNDPNDFYRPAVEYVQDDDQIVRFGYRETSVQAVGCTSRGQAHRFGKWILDTEKSETETVEFTMAWDGYVRDIGGGSMPLVPGNIIQIADPRKTGGVRIGGRLKQVNSASQLVLDAAFAPTVGITYNITVVMPDGSLEKKDIDTFSGGNLIVDLASPLSQAPTAGAIWVIQGIDINARRYRVMAVEESETDDTFKVTALFNDPTKYARIEQNIALDPIAYTRPKNIVTQVTNVTATETHYFQNGVSHNRVILSWTPPNDFLTQDFGITADTPRGFVDFGRISMPSLDIGDAVPGDWTFYVNSRTRTGIDSPPVAFNFTVKGWENVTGPIVNTLTLVGAGVGNTYSGTAPTITWTNDFPTNEVIYECENVVRVYDSLNNLLRVEVTKQKTYTYSYEKNINDGGPRRTLRFDVTVRTVTGTESAPASLTVTNPVPAVVTPTFTIRPNLIEVNYTPPADPDFAGAMIWVSPTNGFDPLITTPSYDGPDTKVSINLPDPGTYYIRIAAYDVFGKTGLNVSAQFSQTVADIDGAIADVLPALLDINRTAKIADVDHLAEAVASLMQQVVEDHDANDSLHQYNRQLLAVHADNIQAAVLTEQIARIDGDNALSQSVTALTASVGDNNAAILAEQTARANADSALATSITELSATVDGNTAGITAEAAARATEDSALAASITDVEASVGDISAGGLLQIISSVDTNGALAAIDMQVRASLADSFAQAGIQLAAFVDSNGNPYSRVRIYGDRTEIGIPSQTGGDFVAPFSVQQVNNAPKVALSPEMLSDKSIITRNLSYGVDEEIYIFEAATVSHNMTTWWGTGSGLPVISGTVSGLTADEAMEISFVSSASTHGGSPGNGTDGHLIIDVNGTVLRDHGFGTFGTGYAGLPIVIPYFHDGGINGDATITVTYKPNGALGGGTLMDFQTPEIQVRRIKRPLFHRIDNDFSATIEHRATYSLESPNHTFVGVDIGASDPKRVVLFALAWQSSVTSTPSMTANGVGVTLVNITHKGDRHLALYQTSGDVIGLTSVQVTVNDIAFDGGTNDLVLASARAVVMSSSNRGLSTASSDASGTIGLNLTHQAVQKSIVIACAYSSNATTVVSGVTNGTDTITETYDSDIANGSHFAFYTAPILENNVTRTWTLTLSTNSGNALGLLAAWR